MAYRKFSTIAILFILSFLTSCKNIDENGFSYISDIYTEKEEVFKLGEFRPQRVKYVVLHCTADQGIRNNPKEFYLNIWKRMGWSRPGYNYLIAPNGKIDTLVPINNNGLVEFRELANGVAGINSQSIHISYQGGIDSRGRPKDTRTKAQKESINKLLFDLRKQFPWIDIVGHNQFANKACPSFNVKKEYNK